MHHVLNHPLIKHKLGIIRAKETTTKVFRQTLSEIAGLLVYESMKDLPIKDKKIETPVSDCIASELVKEIVIIPVLRAGLGLVEGITNLVPEARIGHIGLYRDEKTLEPHEYYCNLPSKIEDCICYVLDPMLATGGSADAALVQLKKRGVKDIKLICLVGAPEGLKEIETLHPDVDIYLAALDEKLNEKGYIVPGLGDAGDRIFGTY